LIEIASTAEFLPEQAALQDSWSARIVCEHRPPTPTASGTHAELLENGLKHRWSPSNYRHCRSDWFEDRKADQNQAIQMKPFPCWLITS